MKHKTGFTIIEVTLVLAIAGIIFLMAFIALPSLWASQRDAERKANVMEYVAALKSYQTNNSRGALPIYDEDGIRFTWNDELTSTSLNSWQAFVKDYVTKKLEDPDGSDYEIFVVDCKNNDGGKLDTSGVCKYSPKGVKNGESVEYANNPDDPNLNSGVNHIIYTFIGATCEGDYAVRSSNPRNVAVVYIMERAGRYCYNT